MTVSSESHRRLSDEEEGLGEHQKPLLESKEIVEDSEDDVARSKAIAAAANGKDEKKFRIHPAVFIGAWIFLSSATIFHNKYILDDKGFHYPAILTCWHMTFATILTQILARFTTFLDSRKKVKMTGRIYLRAILPIGILYSLSLVGSNLVYMHLSVAFIQILKATSPAMMLFATWSIGVAKPDFKMWINVLVIVIGIVISSFGELHFVLFGVVVQILAVVCEAYRLALIQRILSSPEFRMDPMVSLYFYAPVCAVLNLLVAFMFDIPTFSMEDLWQVGLGQMLMNASIAFMLNISSLMLIGTTSALVLVLSGILKNILIVYASMVIWGTVVTPLEFFGYGISMLGLLYFNLGEETVKKFWTQRGQFWEIYGARAFRPRKFVVFLACLISFFALGVSFAQLLYTYGFLPYQIVAQTE